VISFTSDWLYPTYQARSIVKALEEMRPGREFCEIEAQWGHDAFLIPGARLKSLIHGFLQRVHDEFTA
jgi:homoserine O-acetyltransferase/O-succinyltransferase